MRRRQDGQRGYTLIEMLVVVALIGLISLFSVPAFMTYQRSAKIRGSLRQLTSDFRNARQRAITKNRPVRISFNTGSTQNSYFMYDGNIAGTAWTPSVRDVRSIDADVFFHQTTFVDKNSDGKLDIIFRPNGTVDRPAANVDGEITIRTPYDIPTNQYIIQFKPSGQVTSIKSHF